LWTEDEGLKVPGLGLRRRDLQQPVTNVIKELIERFWQFASYLNFGLKNEIIIELVVWSSGIVYTCFFKKYLNHKTIIIF
jgi:hypothetical protein